MTVSLSLLAGAGWQFFDDNGNPLSGGLLYTYEAGTTTPQTTYTDSNGNVANSNPIVLDAAGRVPYQVWLTSQASYKFILKTSTGVTVWSEDDVPAEVDFATLAASSGSSLIGFLQAGTGAVARTVQSKLRDVVSVLDFGADPTGVADSTTAIQAALDQSTGRNPVYFPPGTYKITDEIVVRSGMRIHGASNANKYYGAQQSGHNPSTIWQATSGKAVFSIGGGVSDVVISDFALTPVQTPSAYTAYTANTYGVRMMGANYVAGGTAYQQAGRSSYRILLQRLMGYQFERFISCTDYYWDTTGMTPPNGGADWQCDAVTVDQCHSFGSLHSIYLQTINADAWVMTNCTASIWANGTGINYKRSGYTSAYGCYWTPAEASPGVSVSNTTGVLLDGYWDTVLLNNCAASDGITYCFDRSAALNYDNVYQPLVLQGCVFEGLSRVQRQTKVISVGCRFTDDVICSGDDIEVYSLGDGWNPTTKSYVMSGLRPKLFSVQADKTIFSGDLVINTAAKGVSFIANTPAAGMTSQLLNWYEEGTWTPAVGGTWTSNPTGMSGNYTRIGRVVYYTLSIANGTKSSATAGWITGMPHTPATNSASGVGTDTNITDMGIATHYSNGNLYLTSNSFSSTTVFSWFVVV